MFIIDNIINILFSKQFIQYFSHRFILKMDRYFPGGIDLPQVISKIKINVLDLFFCPTTKKLCNLFTFAFEKNKTIDVRKSRLETDRI